MIASLGATCRSRLQTSSSSRPHHLSTLRKIPKECRSRLHRSGSLKLRSGNTYLEMGWEKCTSVTTDGGRKTSVVGRIYEVAGTGALTVRWCCFSLVIKRACAAKVWRTLRTLNLKEVLGPNGLNHHRFRHFLDQVGLEYDGCCLLPDSEMAE
jgi:hypothetical protein